jgi:uncharacterized membrane protein YbaN (DUF454 family)
MVIGTISCSLGLLGVILPGLPTTPFLLVAVIAYSKGSSRFHTWFTQTRFYKKYLQSIHEHSSITRKHKKYLMLWSDFVVFISFLMVDVLILRLMLIGLVIIKYWYFHYFVTIVESSLDSMKEVPINNDNLDILKG